MVVVQELSRFENFEAPTTIVLRPLMGSVQVLSEDRQWYDHSRAIEEVMAI